MSNPGYQPRSAFPMLDEMMARRQTVPGDAVHLELAALREEIAGLRRDLQPPKSVIITGPEVERVMKTIGGKA